MVGPLPSKRYSIEPFAVLAIFCGIERIILGLGIRLWLSNGVRYYPRSKAERDIVRFRGPRRIPEGQRVCLPILIAVPVTPYVPRGRPAPVLNRGQNQQQAHY